MKTLHKGWLEQHNACEDGMAWFLLNFPSGSAPFMSVVERLLQGREEDYLCWLINSWIEYDHVCLEASEEVCKRVNSKIERLTGYSALINTYFLDTALLTLTTEEAIEGYHIFIEEIKAIRKERMQHTLFYEDLEMLDVSPLYLNVFKQVFGSPVKTEKVIEYFTEKNDTNALTFINQHIKLN